MADENYIKGNPIYVRSDCVEGPSSEVSDALRDIIEHWVAPKKVSGKGALLFASRSPAPAGVDGNPFKPGSLAAVAKNPLPGQSPCGFVPSQIAETYRMTSIEGEDTTPYENQIRKAASFTQFQTWYDISPDHHILPHKHRAYLDENGNGYTFSTELDFSFIGQESYGEGEFAVITSPKTLEEFLEQEDTGDVTGQKMPHQLSHHMHKVINYEVQEAITIVPREFELNLEGVPTGEYMYEPQSHSHNKVLFDAGFDAGPVEAGTSGIDKSTSTSYDHCDIGLIEGLKLRINADALVEEGVVVENNELSIYPDVWNLITNGELLDDEDKETIKEYWEAVTPRLHSALWNKTDKWLSGIFSGMHEDHTFKSYYPKRANVNNEATGIAELDVKYNYNQERYEKAAAKVMGTHLLPNLNLLAFIQEHQTVLGDYGGKFNQILELGAKLSWDSDEITPLIGKFYYEDVNFGFFSLNGYFKSWAKAINTFSATGTTINSQLQHFNEAKHLLFDHTGEPIRNSYNDKKSLFPMYTEMTFQTSPPNPRNIFIDNFKDDFSIRWLMEKMVDNVNIGPTPLIDLTHWGIGTFPLDLYDQDGPLRWHDGEYKTWDMSKYIKCPELLWHALGPNIPGEFSENLEHKIDNALVLTGDPNLNEPDLNFLNTKLFSGVFNSTNIPGGLGLDDKFENAHSNSDELFRCMFNVYNGGTAYSELMFFKVEKLDADKNILQDYYIPQPKESDLINFIDTQIKYGDTYEYRVKAYVLVAGNEYEYLGHINHLYKNNDILSIAEGKLGVVAETNFNKDTFQFTWHEKEEEIIPGKVVISGAPIEFAVFNRPSVHLVEVPYISFATITGHATKISVVDDPPLPPDVEIIPFKGVKDKMLFWLNQSVGETLAKPIAILPEDKEKFMKVAQGDFGWEVPWLTVQKTLLRFKSDDYVKQYQVFRIDKKPASYEDFAVGLREPELEMKQDSFVDKLEPNKKYYYIFRAVDIHGNISNPTPVYEVELVFNSGAVYPVTKIVDFESPVSSVKEKPMRRFVHIVPSFAQSKMNVTIPDEGEPQVSFGDVFSSNKSNKPKRFKIRFTSKSTGRKFDLNLKMLHAEEHDDRWQDYLKKVEQEGMLSLEEEWLKNYET